MLHARAARGAHGPAAASSESAIGVDLQMSFTMLFAVWSRHGTDRRRCHDPHALRLFWETSGEIARGHRGLPDRAPKQSEITRTDIVLDNISLSQEFRISQTPDMTCVIKCKVQPFLTDLDPRVHHPRLGWPDNHAAAEKVSQ